MINILFNCNAYPSGGARPRKRTDCADNRVVDDLGVKCYKNGAAPIVYNVDDLLTWPAELGLDFEFGPFPVCESLG